MSGAAFSLKDGQAWEVCRPIPLPLSKQVLADDAAPCSGCPHSERQGVQEEPVDDGRWRHQVFQLQVEDALEAQGAELPQFFQGTPDLGLGGLQSLSLTLVIF